MQKILIASSVDTTPEKEINQKLMTLGRGWKVVSTETTTMISSSNSVRFTVTLVVEGKEGKATMPIKDLYLSVRSFNCLEAVDITTVDELLRVCARDLLKIRSFGKTSLREVQRRLQQRGLTLKGYEVAMKGY